MRKSDLRVVDHSLLWNIQPSQRVLVIRFNEL